MLQLLDSVQLLELGDAGSDGIRGFDEAYSTVIVEHRQRRQCTIRRSHSISNIEQTIQLSANIELVDLAAGGRLKVA